MHKWIRQNLVLVSGILLPVLLVAAFFVLNSMPRILTDPPGHDFLVVGYQNDYQNPSNYYLSFEVRDGKLHGRAIPYTEDNRQFNRQHAAIFLYHVADQSFEEIAFDLPANLENIEEPISLDLGEAGKLNLDKRIKSPDGYQFEFQGYRGGGGILGEIFGMNRDYESNYVLKKDSSYVNVPDPSIDPSYYQNELHFMGWIVPEDSAP